MKGLELAKAYYEAYGISMLDQFLGLKEKVAVGLVGSGSECFGYDDHFSKDHDFEPSFCIFLPDESVVDRRTAFLLERAYAKLPMEFMGYARSETNMFIKGRRGVIRTADFYISKTGLPDGDMPLDAWLAAPEFALAEAVNGEVFFDGYGQFTAIRQKLSKYPRDVRLKKLAAEIFKMGQAGQYNHARCLARGEVSASRYAAFEFVQAAMHAVFLLNDTYMPYYKWKFRAMRTLPKLIEVIEPLEQLLAAADIKNQDRIEQVTAMILDEVRAQGISCASHNEAELHAYAIQAEIEDNDLRTRHISSTI